MQALNFPIDPTQVDKLGHWLDHVGDTPETELLEPLVGEDQGLLLMTLFTLTYRLTTLLLPPEPVTLAKKAATLGRMIAEDTGAGEDEARQFILFLETGGEVPEDFLDHHGDDVDAVTALALRCLSWLARVVATDGGTRPSTILRNLADPNWTIPTGGDHGNRS